ncbi:acyltransferase family protein [Maribacter litoralis]|uniref:acyltransferase family protein n=1 Tax=Maribacter litoralis TaxID=2059726 RepID=UPI003D2AA86A
MKEGLKYIQHIDFLRAIAVILVILFHLDIQLFKGGFIGVDVFFVISGFLISRNIKHELETTGGFGFKNFYIGRVRRLLPTLFLVIFLTFIFGFLLLPPSLFSGFVKSMFFSSFATSNLYFLSETSYFDVTASLKPLLHTWSLGVEEQFYLIFPMVFVLMLRFFKKNWAILTFLILLIIAGLVLNISVSRGFLNQSLISSFISGNQFSENVSSIQFFLLPFRVFEFLLGALIIFLPAFGNKLPVLKTILNLLGLFLIVLSAMVFGNDTSYMSTLNIIPCIGASLFIANAPNFKVAHFYGLSVFKMLGKISYTLYLFHWPIIVFYDFLNGDKTNILENLVLVAVMITISYFVYYKYENPLRIRNPKTQVISNSGLISVLLLCLIIISNIKVDVVNNNGWSWRVEKKLLSNNLKALENPVEYNTMNWGAAGYGDYGFLNASSAPKPDMIWLGDSHAGHYSYGLDLVMSIKNKKSIFMSYGISTLHLPETYHKKIDSNLTNDHLNKVIGLIKRNPQAVVVLSHFWNGEMSMVKVKNEEINILEELTLDAKGYKKVGNKILRFSQILGNRKIIVVGESPFKNKNDLSYIDNLLIPKYISGFSPPSSFEPSSLTFEINSFFKSFFDGNENIQFIDPTKPLCSDGRCLEQENGNIYFSDKDHLSKSGSLKVVESFEDTFLKSITEAKESNSVEEFSQIFIEIGETVDHKSDKIDFESWYNAEPQHRWSSGESAMITFHFDSTKPIKGKLDFDVGIWKNQHVSFYLNDVQIGNKELTGWNKTFSVLFDPNILNKGKNKLKLVFSNSESPSLNDQRIIALAFRSMSIE